MSDNSELKRVAEACGDLNWRAIQENWCEWAIRDDHGYIATMRTKSAKHPGPCPDREAKAKFLCAVTPAAVLALIAENERLNGLLGEWDRSSLGLALIENTQLKAENERLRVDLKSVVRLNNENADLFKEKTDQLRAEVAGLKTGYEAYERVNAELKAEVELLESSRAKLAGELSRLRAKHKDWSVIAAMGKGEQS